MFYQLVRLVDFRLRRCRRHVPITNIDEKRYIRYVRKLANDNFQNMCNLFNPDF